MRYYKISYDYTELINEIKEEIEEGLLKMNDIIQVLRGDRLNNLYTPIIDYYYNDERVQQDIIYEIFDTYGDEIYEMSDAVLCDKIISHCRQYIPVPINIETSLRTNTTSKVLLNNAMRDYGIISSEVILNGFSHTYPSISDELETLSIFCDHYTGLLNQDTRDSYTTSFISTVNASAIPIASKDFLIASISTANYSTKLWIDNQ